VLEEALRPRSDSGVGGSKPRHGEAGFVPGAVAESQYTTTVPEWDSKNSEHERQAQFGKFG
jgi:hypothetical protein